MSLVVPLPSSLVTAGHATYEYQKIRPHPLSLSNRHQAGPVTSAFTAVTSVDSLSDAHACRGLGGAVGALVSEGAHEGPAR